MNWTEIAAVMSFMDGKLPKVGIIHPVHDLTEWRKEGTSFFEIPKQAF